jgi:DNA-binding PucR family transcriptional regulator
MIFANDADIIEAETERDQFRVRFGQDVEAHWAECYRQREHNLRNSKSAGGHFQKIAELPEITVMQLEGLGIMQDPQELKKWLKTEVGQRFRVSKDVLPIKGDGLQLIIK